MDTREEKILSHLKHSQRGQTFADLLEVCSLTNAAERSLDKMLQRMRKAGLIEFNRSSREWQAVEQKPAAK